MAEIEVGCGKREKTIMEILKETQGELDEIRVLMGFSAYIPPMMALSEGDSKLPEVAPQPFSLDALEFLVQLLKGNSTELRQRTAQFKGRFQSQLGE